MEITRITLPPITAPGEVTTFYSFESGTARSVALSNMAVLLAGRNNATVPVLMIDWDTESPGLHHYFDQHDERPGVLEYFEACRDHIDLLARTAAPLDDVRMARQVLEAVDWEPYVERVDHSRPLYLMRAGRFDATYGERADRMDWDGLFAACPAFFRCFGEHMARRFRHVLVDARSGRSAAVSICTTLLPRKLVTLFTPNQRSLEGLAGVVNRSIEYRCSHEDEQRPLLVYPLPCSIDSADCARRLQWRRGDPQKGLAGYQPALEKLLRESYGLSQLSLDSYLDEVQLQQTNAMSSGEHLSVRADPEGDRFSLTRTFETLLDWVADGHFPWQSHAEVGLLTSISAARLLSADGISTAVSVPLAADLKRLGDLYRRQGRERQAQQCYEESTRLRQRLLGEDHADTRLSRSCLADLLRKTGKLDDAKFLYEQLADDCRRLFGADHPDTLAAQAGLAATLAQLGDFAAALPLHEDIADTWERLFGANHAMTLASIAALADTVISSGNPEKGRFLYERVRFGRERLLGSEHEDTLRSTERLSLLLCQLGETGQAIKLQQSVLRARERHAGAEHRDTVQAREAMAEILAVQGDLDAVRAIQETLVRSHTLRLGAEHPDTLSAQLRLATTLGEQGELDAARVLQEHVVKLHERILGMDDIETLYSKKLLSETLSNQGNATAARKLSETVQRGNDRLRHIGMASGPHESDRGELDTKAAILEVRGAAASPKSLAHELDKLRELMIHRPDEARELADSLHKMVLRPNVATPLRRKGVQMIKKVYEQQGDKDALLAFSEAVELFFESALLEAVGGKQAGGQ
ncbi:MAG: tetratricopeptide repeat protein [Pseudomonadota bacterium]